MKLFREKFQTVNKQENLGKISDKVHFNIINSDEERYSLKA